MQKRLLGTLAAVTAGAGVAAAQAPPQAIAQVAGYADPIPPGIGGPGGPAFGPGMGMPPGMMSPGMGMGMPGPGPGNYQMPGAGFDPAMGGGPALPPGLHGDQLWTAPPPVTGPFGGSLGSRAAARSWFNVDYLLYFAPSQPGKLPFVTTSAPNDRGLLGRPTTTVLIDTRSDRAIIDDLGYDLISGFRVDAGRFLTDDCRWGVAASGYGTEQRSGIGFASSDRTGQPLLARPFINAITGQPDVLLVSFPTFAAGSVNVATSTQSFGADLMGLANIYRSCPSDGCAANVNLMAGFRFNQLREDLGISQRSTIIAGTAPFDGKVYSAPAAIEVRDLFVCTNDFYGGQIGLSAERRSGRYLLSVNGKVAAGVMHQRVMIEGTSALVDPTRNIASRVTGGLFANATNIGRYNNDEFAVIPEINVNLGYNWTSWLSTTVGYNFLYLSRVARPGSQFNAVVNPTIIPTSPNYGFGASVPVPNFTLNQDDFWLQGVNFGINFRY